MNLHLKTNRIMKTQNTLENKERFFAQYFGQHVLYFSSDFLRKIDNLTLDSVENDDYLELKPLSQISDEDAIKISKEFYAFKSDIRNSVKELFQEFDVLELSMEIGDYLRSKGYALPWMDLSVEDLVEYGWVKLKEE